MKIWVFIAWAVLGVGLWVLLAYYAALLLLEVKL